MPFRTQRTKRKLLTLSFPFGFLFLPVEQKSVNLGKSMKHDSHQSYLISHKNVPLKKKYVHIQNGRHTHICVQKQAQEYIYNTVTRWIINSSKQVFSHTRFIDKKIFTPEKSILFSTKKLACTVSGIHLI